MTSVCIPGTPGLPHRLVSSADEKILRVFDAPACFVRLLAGVDGAAAPLVAADPLVRVEQAYVPELGLSNKVRGSGGLAVARRGGCPTVFGRRGVVRGAHPPPPPTRTGQITAVVNGARVPVPGPHPPLEWGGPWTALLPCSWRHAGAVQALNSASDGAAFVDLALDDPDEVGGTVNEQPLPNPLSTSHLPSDEDLLRVRVRAPSFCGSHAVRVCARPALH
jgi:hypothetical protein